MPALNLDTDAALIAQRIRDSTTLLAACLCAQWCGACRDYLAHFNQLAQTYPDICFVWIDIETHADLFDDYDIENFPTLLIEDSAATRFFGAVLPHLPVTERLLRNAHTLPQMLGAPALRAVLAAMGSGR